MSPTASLDLSHRPGAGQVPAGRTRAFAEAARGSRRARRLRTALPAAGAALVLLVVGVGVATRIELAFQIGDLRISADGLAMDAPKLSGSDGKGRTYKVTAESAVQDLGDPRIIRLNGIRATVTEADGSRADFTSTAGVYDAGGQTLTLTEGITIRASDGTAADLEHASIDLETGEVESDAPVAFSSSLGSIEAQGMAVGERGGAVTFTDGVRMTVDPNAVKNGSTGKGDFGRMGDSGQAGEDQQ